VAVTNIDWGFTNDRGARTGFPRLPLAFPTDRLGPDKNRFLFDSYRYCCC
jgi:hypothetical protein